MVSNRYRLIGKHKSILFAVVAAVCSTFVIGLGSCDDKMGGINKTEYSGEELFRGLFFLEGEVAKKIPFFDPIISYYENSIKENPNLAVEKSRQVNKTVQKVNEINPYFFDQLKKEIESKDFNRVRKILEKGALMCKAGIVINELYSSHEKEIKEFFSKNTNTYDFNSEKDMQKFLTDTEKLVKDSNLFKEIGAKTNDRQMAFAAFVTVAVAVVIWEVAVVVNVVAAINGVVIVFFVTLVVGPSGDNTCYYGCKKPFSREDYSKRSLEREIFIKQVVLNLN